MKKYNVMKGLMAKPKNYAFGDQVGGAAGITNALSTNPNAGGYGLAVPAGMSPGGQQFQNNVNPFIMSGIQNQQNLANVMNAQGGQGMQQQSTLSNMLLNEAQGKGPNPAAQALANATAANTANQAALMAGQRGASANPALIARQAAMQGAANQQTAAGQSALMQAEQQLAAQGQLQQLSANQISQQQAAQNALNTFAQGANAQNIGLQGNINQVNANLANTLIGQRGGLLGGTFQGLGAQQAINSQGTSRSPSYSAPTYTANQTPSPDSIYAQGGMVGPKSLVGMHLAKLNKGGVVPAKVSPGEIYLSPEKAKAVAEGKASPKDGAKVPGKAKVKGDSLKNDTVKANLEEGGVVVPRTKASDTGKAAAFVRAVMAKNKRR